MENDINEKTENEQKLTLKEFADQQAPILEETEIPVDSQEPEVSTDTTEQPQEEEGKGGLFGTGIGNFGNTGFLYGGNPIDFYKPVGQFQQRTSAPATGILDTITDTINLTGANLPKIEAYEDKATQALRNISGLILPSLGLRSMALNAAGKYHASKAIASKAPWLYNLGNSASFSFLARSGIDIGTAGLVDYVAETNQRDDNLMGVLKGYWPKIFQWIPDSWATGPDDTSDEKRAKNVNEGAIFGLLASIIEGVAYLTKAGRSIQRTAKYIPNKENGVDNINDLAKDQFTGRFGDNIEGKILENYARKEYELDLLGEHFLRNTDDTEVPIIGVHDVFDESETLVRAKDSDGIYGAQWREAQIQNNGFGSANGRIGNILHESARKEGITPFNFQNRTLVSEVTADLKKGKEFSYKMNSGKVITSRMIDRAGKVLAATLLHPRVDTDDILGILDEFKRSVEGSAVRLTGKKGINSAIKQLKAQMIDMDAHKARAYLVTAEGGQVADFSEGARLMEDNPISVARTIDLMADRLEVLTVEKGLANFEANSMLSNINAWKTAKETGDFNIMNQTADTILANTNSRLTEIIPKAKAWTETLKAVNRENPQFLKPLLLANEFTDGNVDSLFKLHTWAGENLATFKKAIYDRNPEVPSIVNKAMWSNLFNSALSAFATPIKAGVGNLTGLLGKGSATVFGAVVSGDLARANKAMVAHFALDDTIQKSLKHMNLVFRKAATNPKDVSYVMRGDIAVKTEKGLNTLRAWADAASEVGEDGGKMMLSVFEDLEALSVDPVLRFGGNSMTALDGFAKSVVANTEAKYIALNKLAQSGEEITTKNLQKATNEIYDKWFDSKGMISNDAVDSITSEIALNADSPVVDGMNEFIKRFPAARTFIWFPRTTANVIDTFGKWSPAGLLSADYHKMWGPLGNKQLKEFTNVEIEEILTSKGFPIDENALERFNMLRYEVKGKAALGSLFVTAAGFAAINGRCTGNGHYDKSRQRMRVRSGWKPKSCKLPGTDKVVSYDWMGPIGDWLSLTIDVADNFDVLSTAQQEDLYNKLSFVLGSAFTNRSILSQLEPLHDVLSGNGAAAMRFLSNFGNNTLPLGSLRNELGKIMSPGLRQIRTELGDNLRNRNAWLDKVDPSRKLPPLVDPVDGKQIGYQENWFIRVFNSGPVKIHDQPSKERQFLIDIEFNSSPMMNLSNKGVPLENHEISAINSLIGEQGIYRSEIQRVMRKANSLTYETPDGIKYKGFVNILRAVRRGGVSSEVLEIDKFANIYTDLKSAYSQAKRVAENSLPVDILTDIKEREYNKIQSDYQHSLGDVNELEKQGYPTLLNMAK